MMGYQLSKRSKDRLSGVHPDLVRVKSMPLPPVKWDIVEIEGDPERVRAWFARESGKKYDYLAWLGFLFRRERGSTSKWFCSEAVADCLGYRDAWRFDPNTLFVMLNRGV